MLVEPVSWLRVCFSFQGGQDAVTSPLEMFRETHRRKKKNDSSGSDHADFSPAVEDLLVSLLQEDYIDSSNDHV